MTATLADLRGGCDPAYEAKQLHRVPEAPVVDRAVFILERCKGKVVLDIGASGAMHDAIREVAVKVYALDKPGHEIGISDVVSGNYHREYINLDDVTAAIPKFRDVQIIVCGEVLEHLSNPGWFLERLGRAYGPPVPVIVSVPNAFSDVGRRHLERGIENVNVDHVAYYTFHTLAELVTREGFAIVDWAWYNGRPMFAEGLIFLLG